MGVFRKSCKFGSKVFEENSIINKRLSRNKLTEDMANKPACSGIASLHDKQIPVIPTQVGNHPSEQSVSQI